jgi:ribose 5-phosphate isomerase B
MKIAIACDHGAFGFKNSLTKFLNDNNHEIIDFGTHNTASCDYPDFGLKACQSLIDSKVDRVILSCTNGIGMSMMANKLNGIRAALVYSSTSAKATRNHHDSNVLCLGAKEFPISELLIFTKIWLVEEFEGGRHQTRIDKFPVC